MKKIIIVCSIIVLCAGYTKALTVNIISQQYHVWGNYSYTDHGSGLTYSDSYDIADVLPVSGSVTYSASLYSYSGTGLLSVSAGSDAVNGHLGGKAGGYAEGDWVFSPQAGYNTLELKFNLYSGYDYDTVQVLLEDITAGSQMYGCNNLIIAFNHPEVHQVLPSTEIFSVDPAHQYHLHAYTVSSANFDGIWSHGIAVNITPEPATILILALGSNFLVRRKS